MDFWNNRGLIPPALWGSGGGRPGAPQSSHPPGGRALAASHPPLAAASDAGARISHESCKTYKPRPPLPLLQPATNPRLRGAARKINQLLRGAKHTASRNYPKDGLETRRRLARGIPPRFARIATSARQPCPPPPLSPAAEPGSALRRDAFVLLGAPPRQG